MKILIVGAGIGGLTLAGFLKDSSIEYDLIEKAPSIKGQGYSLCIWNNGRRILQKLGLGEEFDKAGCPVHYYCVRDGKGKLLRNIIYPNSIQNMEWHIEICHEQFFMTCF